MIHAQLTFGPLATLATTARAQGTESCEPCTVTPSSPAQTQPQPLAQPAQAARPETTTQATPSAATSDDDEDDNESGWHRPAGRRFHHGFRVGAMYLANYTQMDSRRKDSMNPDGQSLQKEFGLTSPYMLLLGYEAYYRIVGHSWLNVIMVGNASVAGLDQSKFIPAVSGLIGFELQKSFQLGVGVNLLPDPVAPSHAIIAAGWTPRVGSIQTPVHFFFVPDHGDPSTGMAHNWRTGATVGMNW